MLALLSRGLSRAFSGSKKDKSPVGKDSKHSAHLTRIVSLKG